MNATFVVPYLRSATARSRRVRAAREGNGRSRFRRLAIQPLEDRRVLSQLGLTDTVGPLTVAPVIVAGDPNVSPADSPQNRVDGNTTTSPYAGVGSLFMRLGRGPVGFICTGTPISSTHVLTAAHCLDSNNDGAIDFRPSRVTFYLNYGGNLSHSFTASALHVHPDFTGFANPVVNDDLAIVTLGSSLPAGVPIYALPTNAVPIGQTVTMVGYGQSGDGVNGYYVDASLSVKRVGGNAADAFEPDDEGGANNEVFLFDFDAPDGTTGPLGGPSLGNTVETTLGGGDSGGPSFVSVEGGPLQVVGVNTFTISGGEFNTAPFFGSGGGGILVYPYLTWINSILTGGGGGGDGGGGNGGGKGGGKKPKSQSSELDVLAAGLEDLTNWFGDRSSPTGYVPAAWDATRSPTPAAETVAPAPVSLEVSLNTVPLDAVFRRVEPITAALDDLTGDGAPAGSLRTAMQPVDEALVAQLAEGWLS